MQIGAAIGLAALGTISTAHTQALIAQGAALPAALTGGYQLAFLLASASVAAAVAVVLTVLRPSGGPRRQPAQVDFDQGEAEVQAA
jgi:hypothetical protein